MKELTPEEKKNRRINLSLTDETREGLRTLAAASGTNSTKLAGKIIAEYVKARREDVARYRGLFEETRNKEVIFSV